MLAEHLIFTAHSNKMLIYPTSVKQTTRVCFLSSTILRGCIFALLLLCLLFTVMISCYITQSPHSNRRRMLCVHCDQLLFSGLEEIRQSGVGVQKCT